MIVGFGVDLSHPICSEPVAASSSERPAGRLVEVPGRVAGLGSECCWRGAEPGTLSTADRAAVSRHVAVRDTVEDTAGC